MTIDIPAATRGLTFRSIDPKLDAGVLHAVFGDQEQLRFMLMSARASVAETEALLRRWNEDTSSPQWLILAEDEPAGRITLVMQRDGVYEIGIQVLPAVQGCGIATRAIAAATIYAFESLGACRVYADVDPGNVPCARAFLRAGFTLEGTLIANWKTDDGIFDSEIYAATDGWTAPLLPDARDERGRRGSLQSNPFVIEG